MLLLQRCVIKNLSRDAHITESHLLKVRWSLIQAKTPKVDIKIRGNKIYVKGQLQISQGSPSMSLLAILPQTPWTLLLPPPLPHHDSALWGQKSVYKTAGVWEKTNLFSKVLYTHLIFKLLSYQRLGCLRTLQIMKSYLKLTRFTEKVEAPGEAVLC